MHEKLSFSYFGKSDDFYEIAKLYCATFIADTYTQEEFDSAVINIKKHAGYSGFIGIKAVDHKGYLAGFAYGFTSLPEQFYRKKVESQLTNEQICNWLDDCFEFVELAVHPLYKRQGIGSLLHDKLLHNVTHRSAVLTTSVSNIPAINFYKSKGWKVIKENAAVISEDDPQVILGYVLTDKLT